MKRKFFVLFIVTSTLVILAGCSSGGESSANSSPIEESSAIEVTAIVLSSNSAEITVGNSIQLHYTLLPQNAAETTVTWSSADKTIASVGPDGTVSGIGIGQTNIIASTGNGIYEICSVNVLDNSAYDKLSNREREFIDVFQNVLNVFYDPSSVSLKYFYRGSVNGDAFWDTPVTAKNQIGGYSEKDYTLNSSGKLTESILGHIEMPGWENSYDLDLINKAIQELTAP